MKYLKNVLLLALFVIPAGLMAQSHVGSWKMTVPDGEGGSMMIKVTMKANNTYDVDWGGDGKVETSGTYSIAGDKITIQDTAGSDCTEKGVYKLEVTATQLSMTMISDPCEGRGNPDGPMVMTKV
jgi:hypothetical protein